MGLFDLLFYPGMWIRLDSFRVRIRLTRKKPDTDPTVNKRPDPEPILEKQRDPEGVPDPDLT